MSRFEYLAWFFLVFLVSSPGEGASGFFSIHLGIPDESYRLLRYALSVAIFIRVATNPSLATDLGRFWPLYVLLIVNFSTLINTFDSSWTLIQSLVMLTSVLTAVCASILFGVFFLEACVWFVWVTMVGSMFVAVFYPDVGTLSSFQLEQASLVGDKDSWLGLFTSKNSLGHASGICLAILFIFGRKFLTGRLFMLGILASLVCLVQSKSASGFVVAAAGIISYYLIEDFRRNRSIIKIFAFIQLAMFIILFSDDIFLAILDMLGKDKTFTGRDEIWSYGWGLILTDAWPAGVGFGYSWSVQFISEMLGRFGVLHLHSAYLELFLNVGLWALMYFSVLLGALFSGLFLWLNGKKGADLGVIILIMWMVSGLSEPMIIRPNGFFSFMGFWAMASIFWLEKYTHEVPMKFLIRGV